MIFVGFQKLKPFFLQFYVIPKYSLIYDPNILQ